MDLEVIGFVFEVLFYSREERETAEQSDIGYQRNGVQTHAQSDAYNTASPKSGGGGKTFDLSFGAEKDRVA